MKKLKYISASFLAIMMFMLTLVVGIDKVYAASNNKMTLGYSEFNGSAGNWLTPSYNVDKNFYIDLHPFYPNMGVVINNDTHLSVGESPGGEVVFSIRFDKPLTVVINDDSVSKTFSDVKNITYSLNDPATVNVNNESFTDGGYAGDTWKIFIPLVQPDNKEPVISGQTTFVTNVDDAKDLSYFMQYLSATDETDGDVSNSLKVISDTYTANKNIVGDYKFTVEATDNSGNKTTAVINIMVRDVTKPIITGVGTKATIGYKETWNINNFKATLVATDNYDGNIANSKIVVEKDNYTPSKGKLGTYDVIFAVTDTNGNKGTFTKQVQVIDNVNPTFSGPKTITTNSATILTESDIRAQLSAYDDIDKDLTSSIILVKDNYTGNGNKVGTYTIEYSVTDKAGNKATYVVTIIREDKIPPIIWVEDGKSIKTTTTTPLTFEQIIQILQATGQVSTQHQATHSIEYDEYTGNESEPGIYAYAVKTRTKDGSEFVNTMTIQVLEDSNDNDLTTPGDFNFIEYIKENKVLILVVSGLLLGSIGFVVIRKK